MLTSAQPLFENLPGTYADPLGLADQQAPGVVALIVARYDSIPDNVSNADKHDCPPGTASSDGEELRTPNRQTGAANPERPPTATYDTFIAASGGLVAVARTTPDYRFPVSPAAAVARFLAARDAGHPPALSLYAATEADAARLLETTFYAECLKVHVDGPASAPLVADQLARAGCRDGLLEANDFSDPAAPTVHLVEVSPDPETPLDLDTLLDGVRGRVLLYDREKNRAVAADRSSPGPAGSFDIASAVAEAARLASARRLPSETADAPPPPEASTTEPEPRASDPPTPADRVADDLRQRAEQTAPPSPLSVLVAELQGRTPPPEPHPESPSWAGGDRGGGPTEVPTAFTERSVSAEENPELTTPNSEPAAAPHPLARDLDRLRTDALDLLETAVGRERAAALDAHVRAERAVPTPVPPDRVLDLVRGLCLDDPPRRWHLFKRARARAHADVAALLLAFHAAHGHDPRPEAQEAVLQATQLWTRIHK